MIMRGRIGIRNAGVQKIFESTTHTNFTHYSVPSHKMSELDDQSCTPSFKEEQIKTQIGIATALSDYRIREAESAPKPEKLKQYTYSFT